MSGLATFLFFAAFFFFMMRFGCGAHVGHGGHHGDPKQDDHSAANHADPASDNRTPQAHEHEARPS